MLLFLGLHLSHQTSLRFALWRFRWSQLCRESGLIFKILFYKQITMLFLQRRVCWGSHSASCLLILFSWFLTDSKNLRIGFYAASVSKPDACHLSVVTEIPVVFHDSSPTTLTDSVTVNMIRGTAAFVFSVFLQTTIDNVCKVTWQRKLQLMASLFMFFKLWI
jgi:hypothetical protein